MKKEEIAYIAGIMDGEGTIGYQEDRFAIQVSMSDQYVIRWIYKKFGKVGGLYLVSRKHLNRKDLLRWRVRDGPAIKVYGILKPYLKIKGGFRL